MLTGLYIFWYSNVVLLSIFSVINALQRQLAGEHLLAQRHRI